VLDQAIRRRGPNAALPTAEATQVALAFFLLGRNRDGFDALERIRPGGYDIWFYLGYPEWDRFRGERWF
jgi:hypothetical protein